MKQHEPADQSDNDLAEFFAESDSSDTALDDDATQIGGRITDAREALDVSVDALAESLGVTTETVRGWETGAQPPLANHLNKVAGVLGVGLSWLIMGRGAEPVGDATEISVLRSDLGAVRSRLDDVVNELVVLDQRLAQLDGA